MQPHQGWAPTRNARRVCKMGAQTQHKARPQVGRPNATQGTSASWVPQCNARHIRKLGAPTHVCNANARHVRTFTSWAPQRNARHVPKMVAQTQHKARLQDGHPNTTQGLSASSAPQRNARNIHKLHAPTYVCNVNARHVCNARHVGTSANWAPERNARHVHKMVTQAQNSSATKTSTQGSTRTKDELEDG
jgi:hypothetical protein